MDGFTDDFGQNDIDPAAEFLAREQDQLAGLEDDIPTANTMEPVVEATPAEPAKQESEDNFGTSDDNIFQEPSRDYSSALPVDSYNGSFEFIGNENDDIYGFNDSPTVNDSEMNSELMNGVSEKSGHKSMTPPPKIEPEKIRLWREQQAKRLEEKDAVEETKKEELRNQAKKELEEWYKHHNELIAKNKAANRNAEKELVAEADVVEPGTEWERIARLCDFNPKASKHSKDVSRMRSIILQLKQTPPVKAQ